jgi:phage gp36-like protein
MAYATPDDFKALFPTDESVELSNLDDPAASAANDDRIQAALDEAQSEVDSYVGIVATLPLVSVPVVLKNAVCRIARYRLDAYNPRDSVRQDYEDVVTWLDKLVKQQVSLGLDQDAAAAEPPKDSIAYRSAGRVFTPSTLQDYQNPYPRGWQ